MRITVLGKSPAWAGRRRRLQRISGRGRRDDRRCSIAATASSASCASTSTTPIVDAVVISHVHADHCIDLIPYAYALLLTPRQQPVPVAGHPGTDDPARPRLIVPPGARQVLRTVVGAWGDEELIEQAFVVEDYDSDSRVEIGPLRARFAEVPHFILTHAVELTSSNGDGRFTFGADSRPCEEIVEFARDTDLLLLEATLPRPERTGIRGHLTPGEAGDHAKRAGARRLVLTHVSDELDAAWVREQGAAGFGADGGGCEGRRRLRGLSGDQMTTFVS